MKEAFVRQKSVQSFVGGSVEEETDILLKRTQKPGERSDPSSYHDGQRQDKELTTSAIKQQRRFCNFCDHKKDIQISWKLT